MGTLSSCHKMQSFSTN